MFRSKLRFRDESELTQKAGLSAFDGCAAPKYAATLSEIEQSVYCSQLLVLSLRAAAT